jgi:hypothetical protein
VGLDRDIENLTVRYSSVWPAWGASWMARSGVGPVFLDDGYAMLLKGERRGEGGRGEEGVNGYKGRGIPF